jgi:hypothetical protein
MSKYRMMRMPIDVWEKWMGKKQKITERIKISTNKDVRVPMTEVLRFYGNQQRFEWDDNILPYFLKKKKRRSVAGGVI